MNDAVIPYPDGRMRCFWPGQDPTYLTYHDTEWGAPHYDGRHLFEMLVLEGFQAGLSWITILRKRDAFRAAFDNFEPKRVATFDAGRVEALMQDSGIIRNRAKIEGAVVAARLWLDIEAKQGFSRYVWGFVDGRPIQTRMKGRSDVVAFSPLAERMSKELKSLGFKFVGPTIVYSFMQATGMVNDHFVDCYRHDECAELGKAGHPG